jgi:hypothetical protein
MLLGLGNMQTKTDHVMRKRWMLMMKTLVKLKDVSKKSPVRLLGTRFEARKLH